MKRILAFTLAILTVLLSACPLAAYAAEDELKGIELTVTFDSIYSTEEVLQAMHEKNKKIKTDTKQHQMFIIEVEEGAIVQYRAPSTTDSYTFLIPVLLLEGEKSKKVLITIVNGDVAGNFFEHKQKTIEYRGGTVKATLSLEWSAEAMAAIESVNAEKAAAGSSKWSYKYVETIADFLRHLAAVFSATGSLTQVDGLMGSARLDALIANMYNVVSPIAFVFMVILWLVGIGKSSISTDLFNKEDFIKPLLRLVWGIVLMGLALPILEVIYDVFTGLVKDVWSFDFHSLGQQINDIANDAEMWVDDSWIIGGLLTVINVIIHIVRAAWVLILEVIAGLIFFIVLSVRFIKLAVMQMISPMFFACSVSDKTEKYLHAFIAEYTVYAAQVLVAIMMFAVLGVINATALPSLMNTVVYIAGIICIAGSGKFLRSLLH